MNSTCLEDRSILVMIRIGKQLTCIIGYDLTPDRCSCGISSRKLQQQTNNLEWYDPAAVTTTNGSLVITLSKQQTHNLNYQGGMSYIVTLEETILM